MFEQNRQFEYTYFNLINMYIINLRRGTEQDFLQELKHQNKLKLLLSPIYNFDLWQNISLQEKELLMNIINTFFSETYLAYEGLILYRENNKIYAYAKFIDTRFFIPFIFIPGGTHIYKTPDWTKDILPEIYSENDFSKTIKIPPFWCSQSNMSALSLHKIVKLFLQNNFESFYYFNLIEYRNKFYQYIKHNTCKNIDFNSPKISINNWERILIEIYKDVGILDIFRLSYLNQLNGSKNNFDTNLLKPQIFFEDKNTYICSVENQLPFSNQCENIFEQGLLAFLNFFSLDSNNCKIMFYLNFQLL